MTDLYSYNCVYRAHHLRTRCALVERDHSSIEAEAQSSDNYVARALAPVVWKSGHRQLVEYLMDPRRICNSL